MGCQPQPPLQPLAAVYGVAEGERAAQLTAAASYGLREKQPATEYYIH